MLTRVDGIRRQLVLKDNEINNSSEIFLDIGNHEPVALFGGFSHSAAICKEGEIIFINRNSVKNSPFSCIKAVSLPGSEKASSIACCDESVFVLSASRKVFSSPVESSGSVLNFTEVSELSDKEIICLSGMYRHCLAVSKEGVVFGRGSNSHGRLGLGKEVGEVSSFTEILSLGCSKVKAAYAGCYHSLFETYDGKILSCGGNVNGQLLLSGWSVGDVYTPTESAIRGDSKFCIAGNDVNAIFIGCNPPPNTPNTPNMQVEHNL